MSKRNLKRQQKRTNNYTNVIAFDEFTPQRSRKKKVEIIPRNISQEDYLLSIEDNTITFGVGPAGTGKTLIATLMAIEALKSGKIDRIVITRPAVGVSGEEHGFLPGTLIEKMAPWTRPIFDIFDEYYSPQQLENMIEDNVVEVAPLAYMRGRTFKDSFIIFDEAQNSTSEQMKMILTRIGEGCKMVVTGDLNQHDRGTTINGLQDLVARYNKSPVDEIRVVQFSNDDIERHPIISSVLSLYGE